MRMRTCLRALLGSGLVALALAPSAYTARANSPTWSISPGGTVKGKAHKQALKDQTTRTTAVTCKSSKMAAKLKHGSGLTNPLGKITSVTFSGCTGPKGSTIALTASASASHPWLLNDAGYNPTTGNSDGKITNVMLTISGSKCSAKLGGASPTSPGWFTFEYANSTGLLRFEGAFLHFFHVKGCSHLIHNLDPVEVVGRSGGSKLGYTLSPKPLGCALVRPLPDLW